MIVLKVAALMVAGNIVLVGYIVGRYLLEERAERRAIREFEFSSQGRMRVGL